MIAQMPGDTLRTWQPHDQSAGDAYRSYACLARRTGRIAGWQEWRQNRARANRYSQEERVTSHHWPYAECYASNVIGFFRKILAHGCCGSSVTDLMPACQIWDRVEFMPIPPAPEIKAFHL